MGESRDSRSPSRKQAEARMPRRKKLALIGAPGVGKTSLVARWVRGIFSEKYLSTIGVKIDKKSVVVNGEEISFQVWDLAGDIELKGTARAYIRGTDACLLVADGTRRDTLDAAVLLAAQVREQVGRIAFCLIVNKSDRRQ